jgi:uncharacterized membrane protein
MERFTAQKTLTINKPAEQLYNFVQNFENLPKFTKHLQSVKPLGGNRFHWVTKGLLGGTLQWDAEITEDPEHRSIAWISVPGCDIPNSGSICFTTLSHDRGTEVKISIEYIPPAGALGDNIAKLFGESPQQQIGDDLNRFKMLMETGEIATTEGQSRGKS